ncbi:MAG: HAMP domain-containing histidine kinase [Chloroflexi bacterium]|nr:HAMP domain-containing histidine kinase [Chloroflexota bacterium]
MRRKGWPLKLYMGVVVAAGVATLSYALVRHSIETNTVQLVLAVVLASLIALAAARPMSIARGVKANVLTAPLFAGVLLLPPVLAIASAAAGMTLSGLVLRRRLKYQLFNPAATALYTGLASLAFRMLNPGGIPFYSGITGLTASALAAAVVYLVNRTTVAIAAALEASKNPFHLWRQQWRGDLAQEVALTCLGFAGSLAISLSPWSVGLLIIPVVMVYMAFSRVVALSNELEARMTALKVAEAQLVQGAKMASLGTLVAGIGHQINNPIFAIKGRAELLLDGADKYLKTEVARENVETIRAMSERVANIARSMLAPARASEDGASCTDVVGALETIATLLDTRISTAMVTVIRDYQKPLPPVRGDAIEIQEMLGNLINNSCDAMAGGGTLTLRVKAAGSAVRVEVADTGAGIPESNLSKIFDPFFTTKQTSGGTGLGLYVVKTIAQKYGGTVDVKSEQGKGTTFYISLPIADYVAKEDAAGVQERGKATASPAGAGLVTQGPDRKANRTPLP